MTVYGMADIIQIPNLFALVFNRYVSDHNPQLSSDMRQFDHLVHPKLIVVFVLDRHL
jgi:hypothetical protein